MNNKEQITKDIKATIKPLMVKWELDMFNYIVELEKYCKFIVHKEAKENGTNVYELKIKAGWTKQIERYFGRTTNDLKVVLAKDAINKLGKIDVAVNKKLANVIVETIKCIKVELGDDGYAQGTWLLNNEDIFSFETIYAGGYNIQCLHIRTIYKYIKKK